MKPNQTFSKFVGSLFISEGSDFPVVIRIISIIGLDAKIPFFGVSDKSRLKPVSSATEAN